MYSAAFKNLVRLQKSLIVIASKEDIFEVSILADVWASKDFSVSISECDNRILKVAKDLSKFATTYYGKGGAGLLLVCREDDTVLLLKRSKSVEQPYTWGIPGGAISRGEGWHKKENIKKDNKFSDEDFSSTAFREASEELFSDSSIALDKNKMSLIGQTEFKDGGFTYRTFVYDISLEEKKRISARLSLNWENDRAKWYSLSDLPIKLHFGVEFTKNNLQQQGVELFKERNDELDWIRSYLQSLISKVNKESHQAIKELIEKVSVMIPTSSSKSEDEDHSDFRFRRSNAVHDFFVYVVKELSKLGERKVAIEVMNYASEFVKKPKDKYDVFSNETAIGKLPSREQSAHSGFLYHGSELRNAISILKSGTFIGAGAFTRLSLTSDLSLAAKFGDTIFVFDAKKLQRVGAKKMNYADFGKIEKIRQQTGEPVDENYIKNPWISNIYKYEKEWVLKLPYQIKPGELVKVIYFSDTKNRDVNPGYSGEYSSANEAFSALDAATDVPVEVVNYPSFGNHSPYKSKKVDSESTDLTELVYSNTLSEQATAENLKEKYLEQKKKAFGERELKNDPVGYTIYRLHRIIGELGGYARQLDFKSDYDAGKVFSFYLEIEKLYEGLKYNFQDYKYEILSAYNLNYDEIDRAKAFYAPYVERMKDICEKILSKQDAFKNKVFQQQFGELDNPKEENYIVKYFIGNSSNSTEHILRKSRELCVQNIRKILAIPDIKQYLDANGPNVYGSDYSWYSKNIDNYSLTYKIEDLIRYADPSAIPDDVYVNNFLSLIDSEKIESIPDERLERISKRYAVEGKPKHSGGDKYDDQWIYRHRGYGTEVKKHKLEVMMKAMNKDNNGFEEYDKR